MEHSDPTQVIPTLLLPIDFHCQILQLGHTRLHETHQRHSEHAEYADAIAVSIDSFEITCAVHPTPALSEQGHWHPIPNPLPTILRTHNSMSGSIALLCCCCRYLVAQPPLQWNNPAPRGSGLTAHSSEVEGEIKDTQIMTASVPQLHIARSLTSKATSPHSGPDFVTRYAASQFSRT